MDQPREAGPAKGNLNEPQREQSTTDKPKQPVKVKKPLLWPGSRKEYNNDDSSYSLKSVHYIDQAAQEPNFIGNAYYYNLKNGNTHSSLAGRYAIIYTRPVGAKYNKKERSAVFPPNYANRIIVTTDQSKTLSKQNEYAYSIMSNASKSGHMAAIDVSLNGIRFMMACDGIVDNSRDRNVHQTTASMVYPSISKPKNSGSDPIDYLLEQNLTETGSTVSFGLREITWDWDDYYKSYHHYGFHFIALELACVTLSGQADRQLVVAVKLPLAGDLSSMFILHQEIEDRTDRYILEEKDSLGDYAVWRPYQVKKIYREKSIGELESLDVHTKDMGLEEQEFDPSFLERKLLSMKEPIFGLQTFLAWLRNAINSKKLSENVLKKCLDAEDYMVRRLRMLRAERGFREEASGLWKPKKSTEEAVPGDSVMSGM